MKPIEILEQGRFLGEEFILWLWWRGLTEGGTSGQAGDQSAVYVDDAVQLVTERGDVKTMSLAKGNPAESREAFEALSRGMRPAAARIRILSGDLEWTATLDAAHLRLKGLKMPPSQAKVPADRVADRLFLLEEGHPPWKDPQPALRRGTGCLTTLICLFALIVSAFSTLSARQADPCRMYLARYFP